jgi:putative membrane protein
MRTSARPSAPSVSQTEQPPAPTADSLSDGQIAAVAMTANRVEIEAARLAKASSSNRDVLAFAAMMIDAHSKADQKTRTLVMNIGVGPEDSPISAAISTQAAHDGDHLRGLKGANFDRGYMEAQIEAHQQVLDLLDKQLIPQAHDVELKTFLSMMRPTVFQHLEKARAIAARLP